MSVFACSRCGKTATGICDSGMCISCEDAEEKRIRDYDPDAEAKKQEQAANLEAANNQVICLACGMAVDDNHALISGGVCRACKLGGVTPEKKYQSDIKTIDESQDHNQYSEKNKAMRGGDETGTASVSEEHFGAPSLDEQESKIERIKRKYNRTKVKLTDLTNPQTQTIEEEK